MKVKNLNHANVIECRLAGIPAQIAVWSNGEYSVLDRKGYVADWLEKKVDSSIIHELIQIDEDQRLDLHQTRGWA